MSIHSILRPSKLRRISPPTAQNRRYIRICAYTYDMEKSVTERAADLFAALANPMRIRIVENLLTEPRTVGDIAAKLGISQPNASQHLAILNRAGVLKSTKKGACRFYGVRGPRMQQILQLIEEFCQAHALHGTGPEDVVEDD